MRKATSVKFRLVIFPDKVQFGANMNIGEFVAKAEEARRMALNAEKILADLKTYLTTEMLYGRLREKRRLSDYLCIEDESTATELKMSFYGLRLRFRIEIQFSQEKPIVSIGAYLLSYDVEPKEKFFGQKYFVDENGNNNPFNIFRGEINTSSVLLEHTQFPVDFLTDVFSAIAVEGIVLRPANSLAK